MGRIRLRHLQVGCAVADTGSVRGAASVMHVSAPAISKSLRELEEIVGARLFVRSPRGLVATSDGERLVRRAQAVLQEIEGLAGAARQQDEGVARTMRLGSAPGLAWSIIPEVLRDLQERHGAPLLRISEARVLALAEQLLTGDLDAILTFATPEAVEMLKDRAIGIEQVYVEPVVVVCGTSDPLPRRAMSWAALRARRWILPPPTFTQRTLAQRAFLEAGLVPPGPVIESASMPVMLRFVEAGLGLTAVPYSAASHGIASGTLRLVRTETEIADLPVGFAYRRSASNLAQIHLLRDGVRARATELLEGRRPRAAR